MQQPSEPASFVLASAVVSPIRPRPTATAAAEPPEDLCAYCQEPLRYVISTNNDENAQVRVPIDERLLFFPTKCRSFHGFHLQCAKSHAKSDTLEKKTALTCPVCRKEYSEEDLRRLLPPERRLLLEALVQPVDEGSEFDLVVWERFDPECRFPRDPPDRRRFSIQQIAGRRFAASDLPLATDDAGRFRPTLLSEETYATTTEIREAAAAAADTRTTILASGPVYDPNSPISARFRSSTNQQQQQQSDSILRRQLQQPTATRHSVPESSLVASANRLAASTDRLAASADRLAAASTNGLATPSTAGASTTSLTPSTTTRLAASTTSLTPSTTTRLAASTTSLTPSTTTRLAASTTSLTPSTTTITRLAASSSLAASTPSSDRSRPGAGGRTTTDPTPLSVLRNLMQALSRRQQQQQQRQQQQQPSGNRRPVASTLMEMYHEYRRRTAAAERPPPSSSQPPPPLSPFQQILDYHDTLQRSLLGFREGLVRIRRSRVRRRLNFDSPSQDRLTRSVTARIARRRRETQQQEEEEEEEESSQTQNPNDIVSRMEARLEVLRENTDHLAVDMWDFAFASDV